MKPLENIRVVSLGQYMSAPYCTMLLADMGAEVIKVERPGKGDPRRNIPPYPKTDEENPTGGGFMAYNRNKKSIVIDLRSEKGKEIYKKIVEKSDIVVENMRPGSTDRLGIGYQDLKKVNPRIIYSAISGFGQLEGYRGPNTERPTFDIVVEAMSGIMAQVGFEDRAPQWTVYGLADLYSGLVAAYSTMLALFMREKTGEGQFVDTAMYDAMLSLNERMVMLHSFTGEMQPRGRLRHQGPRAAFKTEDGYVAVNVPDNVIWERLCKVIGREDLVADERTSSGPKRAENDLFVREVVEEWLSDKKLDIVVDILNTSGVPAGPVKMAEDIFKDPQVEARKMLLEIEDPDYGKYIFAKTPMRLSGVDEVEKVPAPRLGEHTEEILLELLCMNREEVDNLIEEKIVSRKE